MVCDFCHLKDKTYRFSLTSGGNKLEYNKETASPAENLLDTQILLNNTNVPEGTRFMEIDINIFF